MRFDFEVMFEGKTSATWGCFSTQHAKHPVTLVEEGNRAFFLIKGPSGRCLRIPFNQAKTFELVGDDSAEQKGS